MLLLSLRRSNRLKTCNQVTSVLHVAIASSLLTCMAATASLGSAEEGAGSSQPLLRRSRFGDRSRSLLRDLDLVRRSRDLDLDLDLPILVFTHLCAFGCRYLMCEGLGLG